MDCSIDTTPLAAHTRRGMAAAIRVMAAVLLLLGGIGCSADDSDPSWIAGMYDDADNDGLRSALASDGNLPTAASTPVTPRVTHDRIRGALMAIAHLGGFPACQFGVPDVRGPPDGSPSSLRPARPAYPEAKLSERRIDPHQVCMLDPDNIVRAPGSVQCARPSA